ncbi:unnamed protein product [Rotaria sp. Silwood2]|nr:unnamed protein product [Rotaria sp. Silwood2]CAF4419163.1 unnamed protein product [Rotaria sp. Silwood2]
MARQIASLRCHIDSKIGPHNGGFDLGVEDRRVNLSIKCANTLYFTYTLLGFIESDTDACGVYFGGFFV